MAPPDLGQVTRLLVTGRQEMTASSVKPATISFTADLEMTRYLAGMAMIGLSVETAMTRLMVEAELINFGAGRVMIVTS